MGNRFLLGYVSPKVCSILLLEFLNRFVLFIYHLPIVLVACCCMRADHVLSDFDSCCWRTYIPFKTIVEINVFESFQMMQATIVYWGSNRLKELFTALSKMIFESLFHKVSHVFLVLVNIEIVFDSVFNDFHVEPQYLSTDSFVDQFNYFVRIWIQILWIVKVFRILDTCFSLRRIFTVWDWFFGQVEVILRHSFCNCLPKRLGLRHRRWNWIHSHWPYFLLFIDWWSSSYCLLLRRHWCNNLLFHFFLHHFLFFFFNWPFHWQLLCPFVILCDNRFLRISDVVVCASNWVNVDLYLCLWYTISRTYCWCFWWWKLLDGVISLSG